MATNLVPIAVAHGDCIGPEVAGQIAGSVGLEGSANIGEHCATFEAIHDPAPQRAGKNLANPSGLLHGGILMPVHIGRPEIAERTIEDGMHTYNIFKEGTGK